MIQEIKSYCSPNQINDCVTDCLTILNPLDFTAHTYLQTAIEEVNQENNKLSLAIGTVHSSKFAEILGSADNTRDRLLRGLNLVTKASTLREEKLVSASATEVYRVLKAHGLDLHRQSYQSESAGIDSLVNELNSEKMKATLDILPESKAFLNELNMANEQFKSEFEKSMTHKSEMDKLTAPSTQKKTVRHIFNNKVIRFLNMMTEVDAETFVPIAKKLAPYTEKINITAKSRKSRRAQEPEAN